MANEKHMTKSYLARLYVAYSNDMQHQYILMGK